MNRFICLCAFIGMVTFFGCTPNKLEVDVSTSNVSLKVHRLDRDLFEIDPDSLIYESPKFHLKYKEFYKRYVENIIGVGIVNDPALGYSLKSFVTDKYVKELYDDCHVVDAKLPSFEKDILNAFKHYNYYFPDSTIPEIVFFFSAAQYKVAVTEHYLGIGVDMYLGRNYENYGLIGLPSYFIESLEPMYMATDAMKGWLATEFEREESNEDLIKTFIHQGKIMYLLDAMMPHTHDTLKIAYSKEKLDWCNDNEFQIWAHFIDNELLYTKNDKEITQYLSEGPFTPGFPRESPARIGVWLGWQIVRAFMDNNKEVTVNQLVEIKDYKSILNKSKYKPSR